MYYLVSLISGQKERQMWLDKRVDAISATFSDFMSELEISLPPLMRIPVQSDSTKISFYRKHFRVVEESDETFFAFEKEFTFLHPGFKIDEVTPERFYAGFDQSWENIARGSHDVLAENHAAGS